MVHVMRIRRLGKDPEEQHGRIAWVAALQRLLTPGAVLGIRVGTKIRVAMVSRVWGQILVPVLPNAKSGNNQLLRQDLSLHRDREGIYHRKKQTCERLGYL